MVLRVCLLAWMGMGMEMSFREAMLVHDFDSQK
jgi:hypothetical protein